MIGMSWMRGEDKKNRRERDGRKVVTLKEGERERERER